MAPEGILEEARALESLPGGFVATLQLRDERFARLPRSRTGLEFVVPELAGLEAARSGPRSVDSKPPEDRETRSGPSSDGKGRSA